MPTVIKEVKGLLCRYIPNINDIRVDKACLGLGYTGVKLDRGQVGMCHSLLSEITPSCCQIIQDAGNIAGKPALELLNLTDSWDLRERIIGIAAVNALSQIVFETHPDRYVAEKRNLIEILEVGPDDVVVLIGVIAPFIPFLRSKAKQLYILERGVRREKEILPDFACEEIVPRADVVVITGSSLANGTIDRLLELSENAKTVAIVGPTVSCIPDPLFDRGVDLTGGLRIINPDKAMQIIAEGGGTPHMRQAGEFVTYRANSQVKNECVK